MRHIASLEINASDVDAMFVDWFMFRRAKHAIVTLLSSFASSAFQKFPHRQVPFLTTFRRMPTASAECGAWHKKHGAWRYHRIDLGETRP